MENSKDHKAAAEPPLDCRVGLDIVKILRGHAYGLHMRHNELGADVADAAADEIERLRSTVATLNSALATTSEANARLQREADRPGIMWCNEP